MSMELLEHTVVVHLDINIWSGRAKLRREDIPNADNLPPEALASLGSKKLIDPALLKAFNTIRARAFTMLDKTGVRFIGSWIIHDSKLAEVEQNLLDYRNEFEHAAYEFVNTYETNTESWLRQFPEWASVVRPVLPDVAVMRGKFGFRWQTFKVMPSTIGTGDGLQESIAGLPDTALAEVVEMVKTIYTETFKGRDTVTKKSVRPVRTLIAKLDAISYISPVLYSTKQAVEKAASWLDANVTDERVVRQFKHFLCSLMTVEGIKLTMGQAPSSEEAMQSFVQSVGARVQEPEPDPEPEPEPAPEPMTNERAMAGMLESMGLW